MISDEAPAQVKVPAKAAPTHRAECVGGDNVPADGVKAVEVLEECDLRAHEPVTYEILLTKVEDRHKEQKKPHKFPAACSGTVVKHEKDSKDVFDKHDEVKYLNADVEDENDWVVGQSRVQETFWNERRSGLFPMRCSRRPCQAKRQRRWGHHWIGAMYTVRGPHLAVGERNCLS